MHLFVTFFPYTASKKDNAHNNIFPPRAEGDGRNGHQPKRETVKIGDYGIVFDLPANTTAPTEDDFALAIEITIGYLRTYMNLQYEGKLENFQNPAIATMVQNGIPQIDFKSESTFILTGDAKAPTAANLSNDVAKAFSGANLVVFLNMLNSLPPGNAFHAATGARLTEPIKKKQGQRESGLSTVGRAGIVGAIGAGGLIVLAIGLIVWGKRDNMKSRNSSSNSSQSRNRKSSETRKLVQESNATVASSTGSSTPRTPKTKRSSGRREGRIPTSIIRRSNLEVEDVALDDTDDDATQSLSPSDWGCESQRDLRDTDSNAAALPPGPH